MKWFSHKVLTFGLVYIATGDLLPAFCALPGSVFPDWIEGRPTRGNYWRWRSNHRGYSHWPVLYGFFMLALWAFRRHGFAFGGFAFVYDILFWFLAGCLAHIAEDMVCGKVPLWSVKKKYGIKLFTVGSPAEYAFCLCILAVAYFGVLQL